MRKLSNISNSRAFTLIETLVAIAILMISISGPLAVANKALTASLYAKDQSIASFLAQEEMEIIKNIRDNNIVQNGNTSPNSHWLDGGLSSCDNTKYCDFILSSSGSIIPDFCAPSSCKLYTDIYGYDHNLTANLTIFKRSFSLANLNNGNCSSGDTECKATVVVSWSEGTVPNAVTVSSELLNVAP